MRGSLRINNKTNITLAVERETISAIQQEAQTHKTSVNAKVNRILNDYAAFGKYFTRQKPVVMAPQIFEYLLENVDEKIWLESWEITLSAVTSQIELYDLDLTLDALVKHLFGNIGMKMGAFDRFSYSYDQNERIGYLVVMHKYGDKWSRIIANAFSNLFEAKFDCTVEHAVSPNTVKITIRQ